MLDVAEESDIRYRVRTAAEEFVRIERPLLPVVAEDEVTTLVRGREDDDKGSEHVVCARSVFMRLEERALA